MKGKKQRPKKPNQTKDKGKDNFVEQFVIAKAVGMSDDDAIAFAVFTEDED